MTLPLDPCDIVISDLVFKVCFFKFSLYRYAESQRKSGSSGGASAPKPAPPKIEPMPDALASEFADFDDGPARVNDVVEGKVVEGAQAAAAAAAAAAGSRKSKKGVKGSRKRRK